MTKRIQFKQLDITDCGAACLASISAYYGMKHSISKIRQLAGTNQNGTNLLGLIEAAEELKLLAKGIRVKKEYLDKIPLPMIAHQFIDKKWYHFVVIYKVTRNSVKIMDPATGKLQEKDKDVFLKDWTGIAMILTPGEKFKKGKACKSPAKRFAQLIKPHRSVVIQALTGALAYSLLGITTSIYIEKLIDTIIPSGNMNLLNLSTLIVLLILVFRVLIGAIKGVLLLKTRQKIDAMLVLGYYRHILKLPYTFFHTMRTGEIISRVNDAVKIRTFINDVALELSINVLIVAITILFMLGYSAKMTIIVLFTIPVYLFVYYIYNISNKRNIRKSMEYSADLEAGFVESLNNAEIIKTFSIEKQSILNIDNRFVRLLKKAFRINKNAIIVSGFAEFISGFVLILLLWTGTKLIFYQELTAGEVLSFYTLFTYLSSPLNSLLLSNKSIQNAVIASDRLFQIMDLETEKEKPTRVNFIQSATNSIKFENVEFKYPGQIPLFKDLTFEIPAGKITAFAGETGTGKSTIFSLIQKLQAPSEGNIYIGKYNLKHLSKDNLSEYISAVPQNIQLFNESIANNIAIGEQPDYQKISNILDKLGILKFIDNLPEGIDSIIHEYGNNFSGGERQKIAIARAIYKDPHILLMDEASSALDYKSEDHIKKVTRQMADEGATVIIIAHRLTSITHADKIIVLNNKGIAESGTHSQLLDKNNNYRDLWNRQYGIKHPETETCL